MNARLTNTLTQALENSPFESFQEIAIASMAKIYVKRGRLDLARGLLQKQAPSLSTSLKSFVDELILQNTEAKRI